MLSGFRNFIVRGNVADLAIGIMIGAAFTGIVTSLVNDIVMPPIGLLLGGIDFSNFYLDLSDKPAQPTLEAARAAGHTVIAYGKFLNAVLNFLIVALVIYFVIERLNKLFKKPAPAAATPEDVALLREIRDLLAKK